MDLSRGKGQTLRTSPGASAHPGPQTDSALCSIRSTAGPAHVRCSDAVREHRPSPRTDLPGLRGLMRRLPHTGPYDDGPYDDGPFGPADVVEAAERLRADDARG